MLTRTLGPFTVSAIGLGEMPLSVGDRPSEADAVAVVHAALDAGVTLIDTADAYAPDAASFGHGEDIVAKALAGRSETVVVATKGGHTREPDDSWGLNGSPLYLASAARDSVRRLGVDAIDLYQFHRPDPAVPWAESIGALKDLVDEGIIRTAGVSNADPDQIREAHEILGDALVAVQNQFAPAYRSSLPELELCGELGIAFLPWSPLGGMSGAAGLGAEHGAFAAVAEAHEVTPQQVCLAWHLAQGEHVIPIPGSSRPATIEASAAAVHIALSADELARLDAA